MLQYFFPSKNDKEFALFLVYRTLRLFEIKRLKQQTIRRHRTRDIGEKKL